MDLDMQHGFGHTEGPFPCCMGINKSMLHFPSRYPFCMSIHATCLSTLHVQVHVHSACQSTLHIHVHAACPSIRCVFMSMLHAHFYGRCRMFKFILHVHVHAASLNYLICQCCMFKSMQHRHGHAVWTWSCSMNM
jgi:hypothetical protein